MQQHRSEEGTHLSERWKPPTSPRVHLVLATVLAAGALAAGGISSPANAASDLIYSQNAAEARILYIDPEANTRVVDFLVYDALPDFCYNARGEPSCYTVTGTRTTLNDHDYVEVAATQLRNFKTILARIPLAQPKSTSWRLEQLDFSKVASNGSCTRSCGDPGRVPFTCGLGMVHEFQVTDENPDEQWVELITTDPMASRVEKVRLDYANGNTCGEVLWVLDTSDPQWPSPTAWPNGVHAFDGPDGQYLLTTFYAMEEGSVEGRGGTILWDIEGGEPNRLWTYPDQSEGDPPLLNMPHGGRVEFDVVTGQWTLMIGHSLGDSPEWTEGEGGTWLVAALADLRAQPDYLGEFRLPPSYDQLTFPRELELLPDGTFQGADSGCYLVPNPDVPCPGAVYLFRPEELPNSDLAGYYSPSHSEQYIITLNETEVFQEVTCGQHLVFAPDRVTPAEFGQELRAAAAQGGLPCPD